MSASGPAMNRRQAFAADLERYRSRLVRVHIVKNASMATLAASGVVALAAIVWTPGIPTTAALAAGAITIAAAVAIVAAWFSAPSLARTAAIVDRELRSKDSLVTAVECLADSDPVADLVVIEAARRLAAASPAGLLPFEMPSRFATLAGAVVLLVLAGVLVENVRHDDAAVPRQTPGTTASPAPENAAQGRRGNADNQPRSSAVAPAAARAGTPQPDGQRGQNSQEPATAAPSAPTGSDAQPGAANRQANSPHASGSPRESASPLADAGHGAGSGAAGNGGSANGRRGSENAGSVGASGGGRSSSVAARTVSGAGGVSGGTMSPTSATPRGPGGQAAQTSPMTSEAAWQRAQAAIARERIPADLRQIVQDYFTAIRRPQP